MMSGLAGVVGSGQSLEALLAAGVDPELVVFDAKVYTMDSATPRAEAFAIKGSRFVAVGSSADMRALAGKPTQLFDAKQMTVVPGFIDCHTTMYQGS